MGHDITVYHLERGNQRIITSLELRAANTNTPKKSPRLQSILRILLDISHALILYHKVWNIYNVLGFCCERYHVTYNHAHSAFALVAGGWSDPAELELHSYISRLTHK